MKQISNREYEKYQAYLDACLHGRCLTPDGLRMACAGLDYDPEKIGKHMLEMSLSSVIDRQGNIVADLPDWRLDYNDSYVEGFSVQNAVGQAFVLSGSGSGRISPSDQSNRLHAATLGHIITS